SGPMREMIAGARDLRGRAVSSRDLGQAFERGLRLLVADLREKKLGGGGSVASRGDGRQSRYIPTTVRRGVWNRDRGRCAFIAPDGRRCGETRRLEFHHERVPYGAGGKATLDNISLRCQTHNPVQADRF